MKEPIVVTEKEYTKGRMVFDTASGRFDWVVCGGAESAVADAVRSSGARVAVLGVEKYIGPLYEALELNGNGRPALIARHGVGFDGINLDRCRERSVILTITKNAPDLSVAEHTIALVLALSKNIVFSDVEMRAGRFGPKRGFELAGKTIGIAGIGNIGKLAARMAAYGFGMKVVAFGRSSEASLGKREGLDAAAFKAKYGISAYYTNFDTFASVCDIIAVLMPSNDDTSHYFDSARFARMRAGTWFVNTSRGRLVDEAALFDALVSGHIAGAALDVFEKEPYEPCSCGKDLRSLRNVVLTSHIASDTEEAGRNMQTNILENIDAYLAGDFGRLTAVYLP